MTVRVLVGSALELLRGLPSDSVHACVTSPPYYGLRSYLPDGHPDKALELGLEDTPDAYVARMVEVFREVRRVLRPDGVCWLNLGDSYAGGGNGGGGSFAIDDERAADLGIDKNVAGRSGRRGCGAGIKPKDLMMMPAQVAIALRADGWWLRSETIWHKPSPLTESCNDRPTSAHEKVYLLTKSERYAYDAEAIAEPIVESSAKRLSQNVQAQLGSSRANDGLRRTGNMKAVGYATRNARNVWTIARQPFDGPHFATMPPRLAELCVKSGTSEHGACAHCGAPFERMIEKGEPDLEAARRCGANSFGGYHGTATKHYAGAGVQVPGDVKARILAGMRPKITVGWQRPCGCPDAPPVPCTVLDPFGGAGTTGLVADRLGRNAILIELNPESAELARARIRGDAPLFTDVTAAHPPRQDDLAADVGGAMCQTLDTEKEPQCA